MLTFTEAGDDVAATARRMTRLRKVLSTKGYALEWVWVVECNRRRRTGGHAHHVHALAHGSVPPAWILSEVAQRAGFGSVAHVRPVSPYGGALYLWSDKKGAVMAHPDSDDPKKWRALDVPHRLWTNGERLHRATHNFWRVDGERVAGWREAYLLSRAGG